MPEVIEMLMTYSTKSACKARRLYINFHRPQRRNCRAATSATLKAALEKVKDQLGPDSSAASTPTRSRLDSKLESEQP